MLTKKIYGYGWVGKAMHTLFPDALIEDPSLNLTTKEAADVAFICVPTPLKGRWLDTSIVEEVVKNCPENLIVIRSTVMPGTTDYLEKTYGKNIVFSPEYLGETVNHPMSDQHARPFIILGGKLANRRKVIELYQEAYNANLRIRQTDARTAEIIKLTENRAIAFKVAQCQELYDACQADGTDYYEVVQAVYGDDPRFNLWWTFVFPKNRGFNSKCIPKDVYGWASWAESVGYAPLLTNRMLEVNETLLHNSKL